MSGRTRWPDVCFGARDERACPRGDYPCADFERLAREALGARSMFTDYGYDAVSVPRNRRLPAGRAADLGLCERRDTLTPSSGREYCVQFRTPSLRNVARKPSSMHNGAFTRLRDVVAFYATRATNPERWYTSGVKFEDTPPQYRAQVVQSPCGRRSRSRRTGDRRDRRVPRHAHRRTPVALASSVGNFLGNY